MFQPRKEKLSGLVKKTVVKVILIERKKDKQHEIFKQTQREVS